VPVVPTLTWRAVPETIHYVVEVATDTDFAEPITSVATPALSHTLTQTLNYSTPYYWRVAAVNVCGQGLPAEHDGFTTQSFRLYLPLILSPPLD
jgi:hypothetical protein